LESLKKRLSSQEAWYARNEIVEFVQSDRCASDDALGFAKAMAGLPQYTWLYSFRRLEKMQVDDIAQLNEPCSYIYKVFELLKCAVKKVKPLNILKVEMMLREELLRQDGDPILRDYMTSRWADMTHAFAACHGEGFKRAEMPYQIMKRFSINLEAGKNLTEIELARREQLV
jgi:hypothetical protein